VSVNDLALTEEKEDGFYICSEDGNLVRAITIPEEATAGLRWVSSAGGAPGVRRPRSSRHQKNNPTVATNPS